MTHDRREFLANMGAGLVAAGGRLAEFTRRTRGSTPSGRSRRTLIVVELEGGNDGLDTIIPYSDPRLWTLRPDAAAAAHRIIHLDDVLGLHPGLEPLAALWREGRVAAISGVGHRTSDRSHFRSRAMLHSCFVAGESERSGWLGRAASRSDRRDAAGLIHVGAGRAPLAFLGAPDVPLAIGELQRIRLGGRDSALDRYLDDTEGAGSEELRVARNRTREASQLAQRLAGLNPASGVGWAYPQSAIGRELAVAARLLAAGLRPLAMHIRHGDFDTHSEQRPLRHDVMRHLGHAVASFLNQAERHGFLDDVVVLVMTEFGRRVEQNANAGTDHGKASVWLVCGGRVAGGRLIGPAFDLDGLDDGDLPVTRDFRDVYAELLATHLLVDDASTLCLAPGAAPLGIMKSN